MSRVGRLIAAIATMLPAAAIAADLPNSGTCARFTKSIQGARAALISNIGNKHKGGYVILFRHGERSNEAARILPAPTGSNPPETDICKKQENLTTAGVKQATAVGKRLKNLGIAIGSAYVSPCFRTYDTGQYIINELGKPSHVVQTEALFHSARTLKTFVEKLAPPKVGTNTVLVSHGGLIRGYVKSIVGKWKTVEKLKFLEATILKRVSTNGGKSAYQCAGRLLRGDWLKSN